ncbi:type VI secretion system-associated protein TagF [Microbulbifer sp. SAOS-129_SWC]|uniref:type VI secretion system-associated protein TagF n=1 Tax=Microbulbifer sp. SAOS-129_SWC TaxID=3145235 RepID=UPI0032179D5B
MTNNGGVFGKLPGHGDFVQRELPGSFVTPWDEWLQRAVFGSRELVGEAWLDYYLTSPIWRFALSPGVVDQQGWAGVLVPSVDSVGRYFPLTLAAPVAPQSNPFALQRNATNWFQSLSDLAIEALQEALQADHLQQRFPALVESGVCNEVMMVSGAHIATGDSGGIDTSYPSLLHSLYQRQCASFSLWWCAGSQHLPPSTLLSPALPEPTLYCSMLGAPSNQW